MHLVNLKIFSDRWAFSRRSGQCTIICKTSTCYLSKSATSVAVTLNILLWILITMVKPIRNHLSENQIQNAMLFNVTKWPWLAFLQDILCKAQSKQSTISILLTGNCRVLVKVHAGAGLVKRTVAKFTEQINLQQSSEDWPEK